MRREKIGTDFPDEFCHSQDKVKLKGGNEKAKANMVSAIGELIQVATNKVVSEDFGQKHKSKAQQGGIGMTHGLVFLRIIRMEYWNDIIFILHGCWYDVMRKENFIYTIW